MSEPRTTLPDATDTQPAAGVGQAPTERVDGADAGLAGSEDAPASQAGSQSEHAAAEVQAQAAGLADDLWLAWQTASGEWSSAEEGADVRAGAESSSTPGVGGADRAYRRHRDRASRAGASGEPGTRKQDGLIGELLHEDALDLFADVLESAAVGVRAFAVNLARLREQREHRSQ